MRQIKLDGCDQIIDIHFVNSTMRVGSDSNLLDLQLVFMSQVMKKVLMNVKREKLNRSNRDHPQTIWKLHQEHHRSSATAQSIEINLSKRLSTLTIVTAKLRCNFLEEFDLTIKKCDWVSANNVNKSNKIGLLNIAARADKALLQVWTAVIQIFANENSCTATTYQEYWECIVSVMEKLEEGLKSNSTRKVNIAKYSYYM